MDFADLSRVRRRLRLTYELARVRLALLGIAPVFGVAVLAMYFGQRPHSALGFGLLTVLVGGVMLWYGRDPQRAVLPGIAAGLVPLVFALCANRVHVCGPDGCSTLCLPACALGGVIAGLLVANVGNKRRAGVLFWCSAAGLALLTGAMGCACIGYTGVLGLGIGFAAGLIPGLVRRARA